MGPNQTYIYFCTAKKTINERKKPPSDWEKIFANDVTNKGLISKIYKQFIQLNYKKANNSYSGQNGHHYKVYK